MTTSHLENLKKAFPLLADELTHSCVRHIPAGQLLAHEGQRCSHFALIAQGTVRVYKLGENGREVTLFRVGMGESCILSASGILSQAPFPAFAVAETDVEAVMIDADHFRQRMNESESWRNYVFGLLSRRFADVTMLLEHLAFDSVDRRLASYLLTSASDRIGCTHQAIAVELGTSREVVSRVLKSFERNGLVTLRRGSIQLLDRSRLQQWCRDH